MFDDKICQSNVCSDKNCQDTKFMQPVKPEMNRPSKEPQSSFKKKHVPLCSDKNCQSTRCYRKKSPMRPMYGNDKDCQETQDVHMQPKKPISQMRSVTTSNIPTRKQFNHKKCELTKCLCDDKNCQSTRKQSNHKKCKYIKCLCDGKDCQSTNLM